MRLSSLLACFLLAVISPLAFAVNVIESNSLNLCSDTVGQNSNFTATYFSVAFTPNNRTLSFSFDGVSSISGKVKAELILKAYGYTALTKEMDPCEMKIAGLCPMKTGKIDVPKANMELPADVVSQIPSEPFFLRTHYYGMP